MKHPSRFYAAFAIPLLLFMAGCEEHVIKGGEIYDPQAAELAKAQPVVLPPAIAANRVYRCDDNALVYVDFYTNNSAKLRSRQGGKAVTLTAAAVGAPFTGNGYAVSANASVIHYTAPASGTRKCKA